MRKTLASWHEFLAIGVPFRELDQFIRKPRFFYQRMALL